MNKTRNVLVWVHAKTSSCSILRGVQPRHIDDEVALVSGGKTVVTFLRIRQEKVWVRLNRDLWTWEHGTRRIGCWSVKYEHN